MMMRIGGSAARRHPIESGPKRSPELASDLGDTQRTSFASKAESVGPAIKNPPNSLEAVQESPRERQIETVAESKKVAVTERTIAIGDIHGCAGALTELLRQIDPQPADTIVTLGDYVNRGPDTRGVIDQLLTLRDRCRLVTLVGNHDEVLLDVLDGRADKQRFIKMGGQATLDSYGPDSSVAYLPPSHIAFLRSCRTHFETATHLFAHANYAPNLRLGQTDGFTLIWPKLEPPYPAPHFSGKRAVVGHTAQRSSEVLDLGHVVCIDTGCCYGGVLTAVETNAERRWHARSS